MDLVVFENNKPFVIDAFREGRFDYIELASDVAETRFFQFLFGKQIVAKLAQHYPAPRERELVPLWMYLSSQLSLRLHGQHGFHGYPLIIRAGGLVDALGPEVARREADPQTGNIKLACAGFNDRNLYPRQTPCDQDFLRKLARDTEPQQLQDWYNRHVAKLYQELGAFDDEGLFIGDGTYLFVPDNPRYEDSLKLLFDEHNHPVNKQQEQEMTKAQRARCRWRRCYKAVLLLHCAAAGEHFVVVGVRVLKVLLLDRGFINGPQIGRLKRDHGIDTVIPIRSDMNLQDGRARADEAANAVGGIRADASGAVAGCHRGLARPPHAPHGQETRESSAEDVGAATCRTSAGFADRPESAARTHADRTLPRVDELVGLSGAADRRLFARRVCRRSRDQLALGDDERGLVGQTCA